jgi:hypothetical protein
MPADLTQLDNRMTALDGVGAQVPSSAQVPTVFRDLNGLHTTISQLTLTLQSQLNEVSVAVATLQASVNNLLGIGGGNAAARKSFTTAGTTGSIDISFLVPFVDDNYTASVSIESTVAVHIDKFIKKADHSGVTVFYTAGSSGLAATAHVVARHD